MNIEKKLYKLWKKDKKLEAKIENLQILRILIQSKKQKLLKEQKEQNNFLKE